MKVIVTELYTKGLDSAVRTIASTAMALPENRLVSPSDANVLVTARRNENFRAVLNTYYWNLPDGVPSVWILKLKGAKSATRCSGPDLFEAVIKSTKDLDINHYLCGGAEGTAEKLRLICQKWGNSNIVGVNSPPFRKLTSADFQSLADQINEAKTHIIWVGLGLSLIHISEPTRPD